MPPCVITQMFITRSKHTFNYNHHHWHYHNWIGQHIISNTILMLPLMSTHLTIQQVRSENQKRKHSPFRRAPQSLSGPALLKWKMKRVVQLPYSTLQSFLPYPDNGTKAGGVRCGQSNSHSLLRAVLFMGLFHPAAYTEHAVQGTGRGLTFHRGK